MHKTFRTLTIGNSFSQDALAYVHQIARAAGIDWEANNLYIPGCPIDAHHRNYLANAAAYSLETNGKTTGRMVSINEMLADGTYDAVTTQQASHFSGKPDTYSLLPELISWIRESQPLAKLYLQETWAYEIDSTHGAFPNYHSDQRYMYECLRDAYYTYAEKVGVDVIPTGDVVQYFRENLPRNDYAHGGVSLNRDGFHLSIPYGRYLNSAVWYETILGGDIRGNAFVPVGVDDVAFLAEIQENVHCYLENRKKEAK